jgi:hypothetical protein
MKRRRRQGRISIMGAWLIAIRRGGVDIMRKTILTAVALIGAGFASLAGAAPAAAHDYPWCVQGRGVGYPGDCSYQTYAQCQASASGRNVGCGINPIVAFRAQRGSSRYQSGYRPNYY